MASKGNSNSLNDNDQKQQPVVDRDKVKHEREARRLAKLSAKQKVQDKSRNLSNDDDKKSDNKSEPVKKVIENKTKSPKVEATDKNIHRKTENHGKPNEKKVTINPETIVNEINKLNISNDTDQPSTSAAIEKPEKKQLTKAERRALQELQRAAKSAKVNEKTAPQSSKKEITKTTSSAKPKQDNNTPSTSKEIAVRKPTPTKKSQQHRVKLFNHLYTDVSPINILNLSDIHPAIARLGVQYSNGIVKGCNARGLAFMNAIKTVIDEFKTPAQKEFSRSLEDVIKTSGNYLQKCRPLSVSVTNAMKFIQFQLRQLNKSKTDEEVYF